MTIRKAGLWKCDICGKASSFEGLCWYDNRMDETHLCRSHYMKWNRQHKPYFETHKNVNPCTKEWHKMCAEESKLFRKWMKKELDNDERNKKPEKCGRLI